MKQTKQLRKKGSEENTTNEVEKRLRSMSCYSEYTFYRQVVQGDDDVDFLFDEASKSGSGRPGRPDLIAVSPDRKVVIIAEVKKAHNNHCPNTRVHPRHQEITKQAEFACSGVRHYLKKVMGRLKNHQTIMFKMNLNMIVGIAASGAASSVTYTTYACNKKQTGFNYIPRVISDGDSIPTLDTITNKAHSLSTLCTPKIGKDERFVMMLSSKLLACIQFEESEFQRAIKAAHVTEIRNCYKQRLKDGLDIPASSGLLIGELGNSLHVIDGQHRLQAYKELLQHDLLNIETSVMVVKYKSLQSMQSDFLVHNAHAKLTNVEEAHAANPTKESKKLLITAEEIVSKMMEAFPGAIADKNTYRARMSSKKVTTRVQTALKDKEIEGRSVAEIMQFLETKNEELRLSYERLSDEERTPALMSLADSASRLNCWLGYDKGMEKWFDGIHSS